MRQRILDTSLLIAQWRRSCRTPLSRYSNEDAKQWGQRLVDLYKSNWIVSPVLVEFLAGTSNREEARLARAFISVFKLIDQGSITKQDWQQARKIAERIPRDGRLRQLGDCLILAIAKRLKCEISTLDTGLRG